MARKQNTTVENIPPSLSSVQAIQILTRQKEKGQALLENRPISSADYRAWENNTREFLVKSFGSTSENVRTFSGVGAVFLFGGGTEEDWERDRAGYLERQLTYLSGMIEQLEALVEMEKPATVAPPILPSPQLAIEKICNRFHLVARQLKRRYNNRSTLQIDDEYDVQNLLHALLTVDFEDIRPEETTPSYAGKSSRQDFLLFDEKIVVEAKMTRQGLGAKEVGSQLIEDIARYQKHPDCKTLVCFVYDPDGYVTNPRGLENDLARTEGSVKVKVFVRP